MTWKGSDIKRFIFYEKKTKPLLLLHLAWELSYKTYIVLCNK